jgi:thiamine biosynthesis lipoprotein ApbE
VRFSSVAVVASGILLVAGCFRGNAKLEWQTMGTTAAIQYKAREVDYKRLSSLRDLAQDVCALMMQRFNVHDENSEIRKVAHLPDEDLKTLSPCYIAAFQFRDDSGKAFDPRWKGPKTLDLGGIAKGYALDMIARKIQIRSGESILLDIGGNLFAVSGDWKIAIDRSSKSFVLKQGMACSTSGERYRGKHIYDPRRGVAVSNNVESVSVIASSATVADALSTTFYVLGPGDAKVDQLAQKYHATVIWTMKD